ncbi:MAG: M28 family peptidase [Gemmatimonadales bacterium]
MAASVRILAALLAALAGDLAAQRPRVDLEAVVRRPEVARALAIVGQAEARSVATLIELASIVSPSGREHERARAVAGRMREIGLAGVEVDSTPNVVGAIPGTSGRAIVFVTMLDDLPVIEGFQRAGDRPRRVGDRVVGPAVELQSMVAAMLTAAEALTRARLEPRHDLIFAGVAREETGLEGMQALYRRYRERAVAFVELLGDGREIAYGAAGAIAWWKVIASGPEGHTMEGGLPNVNQAIARAVDGVLGLDPRRYADPEAAINVGIIRSGEVFNHKPASGWFSIDLRAREPGTVERIGRDLDSLLARVAGETGIALRKVPEVQSLGGQIEGARDTTLTRAALAVSRHLGLEPTVSDRGCCNMRVAVAGGTLAIAVDGERGGARATVDEWADVGHMMTAARQVVLLAALSDALR